MKIILWWASNDLRCLKILNFVVHLIYLNAVKHPYVCNAGRGHCPRLGLSREWRHNENSWLNRCWYWPEIWWLATGTGCDGAHELLGLGQRSSGSEFWQSGWADQADFWNGAVLSYYIWIGFEFHKNKGTSAITWWASSTVRLSVC